MKKILWRNLVKPSTVEFTREGWRTPGFSLFDWIHGYVYARWTYLYISIGTGEHPLAKKLKPAVTWLSGHIPTRKAAQSSKADEGTGTFADAYHGKVIPLDAATRLVTVGEDIRLTNLEKVIPYAKARDLILKNPDHLLALDCPCRMARSNPCLPLDVCLIIGEPFASLVSEHHPRHSRRITPEEAVKILKAEDERGHVHHAFFKDAMLGRFYAICNCCECCCGALKSHQHGTPMLASSGYVCQVDEALCINCGDCTAYCSFNALAQGEYTCIVDQVTCMGCGVCVSRCAQGALSLALDPSKGVPLEICELLKTTATEMPAHS
jgi:Pyruvate/2-oxoacid:ferredoxin oxidoreductase delta subunit